jgi:hypothetical protein
MAMCTLRVAKNNPEVIAVGEVPPELLPAVDAIRAIYAREKAIDKTEMVLWLNTDRLNSVTVLMTEHLADIKKTIRHTNRLVIKPDGYEWTYLNPT